MMIVLEMCCGEVMICDLFKIFYIGFCVLNVLKGVNFYIYGGDCLVIVGVSGFGKMMLLCVLVGFEEVDEGCVLIDGEFVYGVGIECVVIFQELCLFFWCIVIENVVFLLEICGLLCEEVCQCVCYYVQLVGLSDFVEVYLFQLFGGMVQCVGIVCVFVIQFEILLFDELLGVLDVMIKLIMQEEFFCIWCEEKVMMIIVIYDLEEVIYFVDCVLVLFKDKGGWIWEVDVDLLRL